MRNWLRNRNTIEFLGVWERLNNPGSNPVEFDGIRMQAGLNSFTLTPKQWIEKTTPLASFPTPDATVARSRTGRLRGVGLWAASRCQPWFLVFDRADFREAFVRFALS